ncbi:disabled homolog 2-interacting protein-like protein [Lates japonicus]|uniref:Disabled homolog 2-interacting protein-like protein n=1 Tax=Lates japonicus TaxID=270547 RepID=A0AAD3N6W9_LATJO|nr:disabled homolog 2-interacting protein-like protein [Lates japonicus]
MEELVKHLSRCQHLGWMNVIAPSKHHIQNKMKQMYPKECPRAFNLSHILTELKRLHPLAVDVVGGGPDIW